MIEQESGNIDFKTQEIKPTSFALSCFPDPENPYNTDLSKFIREQTLIRMGITEGQELTEFQRDELQSLLSLSKDLSSARRFDPTYIGHMLSMPTIPASVGMDLGGWLNSNTVAEEVSRSETALEPEAMNFLFEMVGYPESASGAFTSGGSLAMTAAITAAREAYLASLPQNQKEEKQLLWRTDAKKVRILVNPFRHYCVPKSAYVLGGLNRDIEIVEVKTDGNFKTSLPNMEEEIHKAQEDHIPIIAIIAIAGETETGLVDPLDEIADLAKKYNIFSIADGAYGAAYRNSRVGHLFKGLEKYDAIIVDPHKTLYVPYSAGAVLFKDPSHHNLVAPPIPAAYIKAEVNVKDRLEQFRNHTVSHNAKRLEGSMGAGPILATLATKRVLGFEGLREILDTTLDRITDCYDRIEQSPILYPLHKPELNLLCFTIKEDILRDAGISPDETMQLIEDTRLELDFMVEHHTPSGYYFSSTKLKDDSEQDGSEEDKGIPCYRAVIMNPRTTTEHINEAITRLEDLIKKRID